MQGKKIYQEKLFNSFSLSSRVPEDNYYCRFRESCLGKTAKEKKFSVTYYREEYERNNHRLQTPKGKRMKAKRQSTVEPVFGTLTQFMGMRKVNTIGIKQANKVMHMAAMAYNLKKYLKFTRDKVKSGVGAAILLALLKSTIKQLKIFYIRNSNLHNYQTV